MQADIACGLVRSHSMSDTGSGYIDLVMSDIPVLLVQISHKTLSLVQDSFQTTLA